MENCFHIPRCFNIFELHFFSYTESCYLPLFFLISFFSLFFFLSLLLAVYFEVYFEIYCNFIYHTPSLCCPLFFSSFNFFFYFLHFPAYPITNLSSTFRHHLKKHLFTLHLRCFQATMNFSLLIKKKHDSQAAFTFSVVVASLIYPQRSPPQFQPNFSFHFCHPTHSPNCFPSPSACYHRFDLSKLHTLDHPLSLSVFCNSFSSLHLLLYIQLYAS